MIIPARNEEDSIVQTINGLKKIKLKKEILVVNDHSTDMTAEVARKCGARVVDNKKSPGFGFALKTGIENANGNYIVPVMADLCDDPVTIEKMRKVIENYDVVVGCRYMKGGGYEGQPFCKSFFSKNYGRLLHVLGLPTRDATNAFKMYRKNVLENIVAERNDFSISVELLLKAYKKGYRITDVPTFWSGRKKGKSKFKILRMGKSYVSLLKYLL
jgi:glycosyltransferase involved in cell wall biosynthesis